MKKICCLILVLLSFGCGFTNITPHANLKCEPNCKDEVSVSTEHRGLENSQIITDINGNVLQAEIRSAAGLSKDSDNNSLIGVIE